MGQTKDIKAQLEIVPKWDPADPAKSLDEIHSYVIAEAGRSSDWYWQAKRWKAYPSRIIRFLAWILAAIGGLLPVAGYLLHTYLKVAENLKDGLWASILLGVAAALFGLDKAFGYSSGWARYVLTATSIRKALEEFRMDWAELRAKAGTTLSSENVAPLLERAKKFRVDVESLVLQETKDWVTEFQNSLAQMEKDLATQLSTLKTQVEKTMQAKEAASRPGLIELTVSNAPKADGATVQIRIEGPAVITDKIPAGSTTFAKADVPAGSYVLQISAKVGGKDISAQTAFVVKPGEIAKLQLALPIEALAAAS